MNRFRIGLALGSGSARGWSHIGVIEALHEAGIEPDVVCGTSIGAMVGAAYAAGRMDDLKKFALSLNRREIIGLLDVRLIGGGVLEGQAISKRLRAMGMDTSIESLEKPFAAVATDLASGREIWLRDGALYKAVRASIALPGLLMPVEREGRWLIDGGLVNPVPVSACRALGAEVIIAVNLGGDTLGRRFTDQDTPAPEKPTAGTPGETPDTSSDFVSRLLDQLPSAVREQVSPIAAKIMRPGRSAPDYFGVLANSINIMQDRISRSRLAGEPPDVMIMPRLREVGLLEFERAEEAIAEGRESVAHALPVLRRLL